LDVCILIPTLNEESTIGLVVEGFRKIGFNNIVVVDGGSIDKTREIAKEKGAKVLLQSGKGKGQALKEAFEIINSDIVVIIDGDGTYAPEDCHKLIDAIKKGADHVIGNRLLNFEKGAFTRLNLIGNKILNFIFRITYGVELYDVLSGYRALKKSVYKNIELKKTGFEIETELTVESLSKGFKVIEVPITYKKRVGKTKLRPIRDGMKIMLSIYELLKRYSPGRYFYFLGSLLTFIGLLSGIYVVLEWLRGVSHFLMAVLTTLLIILGLQVLVLGVMCDLIFRSNLQIRRDLRNIEEEIRKIQNGPKGEKFEKL